jgi:Mn2+/Fe2+ NRAMP family transporter
MTEEVKLVVEEPEAGTEDWSEQVAQTQRYTPSPVSPGSPNGTQAAKLPGALLGRVFSPFRRVKRTRFWPYLALLGPGIVAAAAGDDAGGIATYASAGASYGYMLLWAMLVVTVALCLVQEMCARMGAVTGKGLSDLIREQFGVRWTAVVILVLLVANAGVTISEFVGVAAAAQLFGVPGWIAVPPVAFLIWWSITQGSYKIVERIFLLLSLILFSYVTAAFMAGPNWGEVGAAFITPSISLKPQDLQVLVALIGTTITPYMQLFVQSSVVEKGVTPRDYKYSRFDTVFGAVFSNLIAVFIIIATAATLHTRGIEIDSAADAALALEPVVGQSATILFGLGLFGASMLAAGVLPLATAYSVSEALGFEKGISLSFREAPVFMGLFTALISIGALVAMIPDLPAWTVLLVVQMLNGTVLPVLLFFIVRLASNKSIMGKYTIGPVYRFFAWSSLIIITAAVVLMFGTMLLD